MPELLSSKIDNWTIGEGTSPVSVVNVTTLKIADIIFTGTPDGVGRVKKNDFLEGFLNRKKILEVKIK